MRSGELLELLTQDFTRELLRRINSDLAPDEPTRQRLVDPIFAAAEEIIPLMNDISPNPEEGRRGGVMLIARCGKPEREGVDRRPEEIEFIAARAFGNPAKPDKYLNFAFGKAAVLVQNPKMLCSSQQLEKDRLTLDGDEIPAGAVRIGEYILSFSGYQQTDDTAFCLTAAVKCGLLDVTKATELASAINNSRFSNIYPQLS